MSWSRFRKPGDLCLYCGKAYETHAVRCREARFINGHVRRCQKTKRHALHANGGCQFYREGREPEADE